MARSTQPEPGRSFWALDAVIAQVQRHPTLYPLVFGNARRATLRRFPYSLVYTVHDDVLLIAACIHSRRDRTRWQKRIRYPWKSLSRHPWGTVALLTSDCPISVPRHRTAEPVTGGGGPAPSTPNAHMIPLTQVSIRICSHAITDTHQTPRPLFLFSAPMVCFMHVPT